MPQEEDFRQLQAAVEGVDPEHTLTFCDRKWDVRRGADLAALMRYASLANSKEDNDDRVLAETYRLLQECIPPKDWPGFEQAAFEARVTQDDIQAAVKRIFEIYTARPWASAVKLMAYAVGSIGEFDGKLLLTTGQGLAHRNAREVCNLVYHLLTAQIEGEQRAEFDAELREEEDAQQRALKRALDMIAEKGETQDAQPAASPSPPAEQDPDFTLDLD